MHRGCVMRMESVYAGDWLRIGMRRTVRRFLIRQSILLLRAIWQQVVTVIGLPARLCRASIRRMVRAVRSQSRLAEAVPDAMRRRCATHSGRDKIRKDLQYSVEGLFLWSRGQKSRDSDMQGRIEKILLRRKKRSL